MKWGKHVVLGILFSCLTSAITFLILSQAVAQERVKGIDVASTQHPGGDSIDWNKVYQAGYRFAFVAASYGTLQTDYFDTDILEGRKANMIMGAYHFGYPVLNKVAAKEARVFIGKITPYLQSGPLLLALDVEYAGAPKSQELVNWIREWMDTVEGATGIRPLLYSNWDYAEFYSDYPEFYEDSHGKYDLWYAGYHTGTNCDTSVPPKPTTIWGDDWKFWQYFSSSDDCGPYTIPGINTDQVLLDVFNGSLAELKQYMGFSAADFNYDGLVNAIDFSILLHYWLSTDKPIADIDQNGFVSGWEFSILMGSWCNWYDPCSIKGQSLTSKDIEAVTLNQEAAGSSSPQKNQATLWLSPNKGSYQIGDNFDVDILVNTGGQDVVVAAAYVQYDPAYFRANSIDTTSSIFTMEPEKIIDATNGLVGITRGVITPGVNTTNGGVARINLTALSPTSPKTDNFTFIFTPGSTVGSAVCADDGFGTNMLSGVYGARFAVGPATLEVAIDINPWLPNIISLWPSLGFIPVAILSTKDFDAPSQVDSNSLTFGSTGDEASLAFCNRWPVFANRDRYPDLLCHFYKRNADFQCGDTEGILKGKARDGNPIEGRDSVKIIPCK